MSQCCSDKNLNFRIISTGSKIVRTENTIFFLNTYLIIRWLISARNRRPAENKKKMALVKKKNVIYSKCEKNFEIF